MGAARATAGKLRAGHIEPVPLPTTQFARLSADRSIHV